MNKLARLLTDNKDIKIEIEGYTDAIGTSAYNLDLSDKRAKSVRDYLITRGISTKRLTCKGFGSSSPVGDNISGDGRKLNRRTEIKITGK